MSQVIQYTRKIDFNDQLLRNHRSKSARRIAFDDDTESSSVRQVSQTDDLSTAIHHIDKSLCHIADKLDHSDWVEYRHNINGYHQRGSPNRQSSYDSRESRQDRFDAESKTQSSDGRPSERLLSPRHYEYRSPSHRRASSLSNSRCYSIDKEGHFARDCPRKRDMAKNGLGSTGSSPKKSSNPKSLNA